MKHILFLAALVASLSCYSQTRTGLKGGLNIANLHYSAGNESVKGDPLTSFHVGFVFFPEGSSAVSVQPEILFSMQGNKLSTPLGNVEEKLGYVNVPILIKYTPAPVFSMYAGPQLGMLVSSNKINGTSVKDYYKEVDISLSFGCEFKAGENMLFGARYNLGMMNVDDFDDSGDIKVTNQVTQIYLGILF
ncbi:PorT family protein [Fulvivirga ulvae]|uniref:porin family protein n=1 Tax=Fulvivirga ulvae TaxID=2904245 RepID=UPI001F179872|nr:porin family protein [Fulvivirga ulvae]UII30490.1 PorT family protein [Fulvivirga ulvae]